MDSLCQDTLLAVEQNSNALMYLQIGACHNGRNKGFFHSKNSDDYNKLGTAIGTNTHLKRLMIDNLSNNVTLGSTDATGFYDGVRRNSTITDLLLSHLNREKVGVTHEVLRACQENKNLVKLHLYEVSLDHQLIVEALRGCTNLKKIKIAMSGLDDDRVLQIVDAIRGYTSIEELELFNNAIEDRGCEALATLRNVRSLDLAVNSVGNEGAIAIANSLPENKFLQRCNLDYNQAVGARVSDDFCRSLCNTSSINDIYSSNHTLLSISFDRGDTGAKLASLLKLNRSTENKRHVAIKKILLHYKDDYDMEPLFDLSLDGERDLKALPYVLSWFETAKLLRHILFPVGDVPRDLEMKKISAIYQFVNAMPMLFIPATHGKGGGNKRKRSIG